MSTSSLRKHLCNCNKGKLAKQSSANFNLFESFFASEDNLPTSGVMTSDKLCEQVLRIILAGNLSFSQAENVELVALLRNAYPNVNIPNRRSVTNKLNEQTMMAKEKLKDRLATVESKISLAIDVWSTRTNYSFLGMFPCNVILDVGIAMRRFHVTSPM
jgi:hypothetical protein